MTQDTARDYATLSDECIGAELEVLDRTSRATYFVHPDLGHLEASFPSGYWSTLGSPRFDSLQDLALWIVEMRDKGQA